MKERKPVDPELHAKRGCKVCAHEHLKEIEAEFIRWTDPVLIAEQYGFSRAGLARHATALALYEKRRANARAALERLIERGAGAADVTGAVVVQAVQALAKIDDRGRWVERVENVTAKDIFDQMTPQELRAYATSGRLPAWAGEPANAETNEKEPDDEETPPVN